MVTPASKRRELVTIQQKNLVDNGKGGRRKPDGGAEWVDVATGVYAEIIPLRGNEALQNLVMRNVQFYRCLLYTSRCV